MKGEKYGGKKIDGVSVIKTRFFFPPIYKYNLYNAPVPHCTRLPAPPGAVAAIRYLIVARYYLFSLFSSSNIFYTLIGTEFFFFTVEHRPSCALLYIYFTCTFCSANTVTTTQYINVPTTVGGSLKGGVYNCFSIMFIIFKW